MTLSHVSLTHVRLSFKTHKCFNGWKSTNTCWWYIWLYEDLWMMVTDSYTYCKVLKALTTRNKNPIIQHYLMVFKWQSEGWKQAQIGTNGCRLKKDKSKRTSCGTFSLKNGTLWCVLPCFLAVSFMDTTSEPALVSLMARAPTCSPVINCG